MDQLIDTIKAYLAKDWGQVLLTVTILMVALTFVGAPRAVSEMIGLVAEAYSPDGHGNDLAPLFILAGVPAGLLARNWKIAGVMILAGFLVTLLGDLNSPDGPEELGQTIISLAFSTAIVAAITRLIFLNVKPDVAEADEDQTIVDILRSKATIGVAIVAGIIGLGQFSAYEVADESAYYDATTEAAEAVEGAEAAAIGSSYPPFDPAAVYGAEKAVDEAARGAAAVAQAAKDTDVELPDFDAGFGSTDASEKPPETDSSLVSGVLKDINGSQAREDVFAPSFDCTKHLGRVEQFICNDAALARQDVRLDSAFKSRLAAMSGDDRSALLSRQRKALAERNACRTAQCVDEWYLVKLSRY